jgi:protein involved in polysaccharide export with SLBB domain
LLIGLAVTCLIWCPVHGDDESVGPMSTDEVQGRLRLTKGVLEGALDPEAYLLGAGDVLAIGFWGDVNRSETVTVNPDGEILLAPVGPIPVDGLTLAEVRDVVRVKLSPYYKPSILSVSLLTIRSFQVHVVGAVDTPGAYEVNAVTRASQAIALANGLAAGASSRNITVRREAAYLHVDLARYLLLGENDANPFLREGDVVYVPLSVGRVSVYGSVYRPGAYEYVEGETVDRLLALAGGFKPEAYQEMIEVRRFSPEDPTVSEAVSVRPDPENLRGFTLSLDDRVFVRAVPDWHEEAIVVIEGEVRYPGAYVVEEGTERVSDVIARAGGLTDEASLAEARLIRSSFANRGFPVEAELAALGEINDSFDEKEKDLLTTLRREAKGAASLSFEEILLGEGTDHDVPLEDGDMIEIPRATWYVRVSGQVTRPGLVMLVEGEGYRYYIKQAGGYASGADRRGTSVIRASSGQTVKAAGQRIRPGDIIWVPAEPDTDWWELLKDIVQVAAQAATIYLLIDSVRSD